MSKVIEITDQAWLQELDPDKYYVVMFEDTPPKIKWEDKPANVSSFMLRANGVTLEDLEKVTAALSPQPQLKQAEINYADLPKLAQLKIKYDNGLDLTREEVGQIFSLYQKELVTGDTSDGYHTFNELYEFRLLYNAALFNKWAEIGVHDVHKSYKHSDGEVAFGGGWFVVVAQLPTGQITNHYENKDWDLFKVPVRDRAAQWDGHTAADVAQRLRGMIEQTRFEEVKATKPELTGEQP